MTTLDIRNPEVEPVSRILVANANDDYYNITELVGGTKGGTSINFQHAGSYRTCVLTKQDTENLILGLKKAIELGWVK